MNDTALVCRIERIGELPRQRLRLGPCEGAAGETLGQVLPFDEFHDNRHLAAGLLDAVDVRDVGVIERGERAGLALEPRPPLGIGRDECRQDLDRHLPIQLGVARPIHLSHPPCAEGADDFIRSDARSRRSLHARAF